MAQEVSSNGAKTPDACCVAYDNKQEEPLNQKRTVDISGPAKIANLEASHEASVLDGDDLKGLYSVMKHIRE